LRSPLRNRETLNWAGERENEIENRKVDHQGSTTAGFAAGKVHILKPGHVHSPG
jgi:hypothetical protein